MNQGKPDTSSILGKLKDFQRRTVDYVYRRLYEDPDTTKRFLIADEVGLGKTHCAQGVIARVIDQLWETKKRLDVIYICSNSEIAKQNIEKLNIGFDSAFTFNTRLTLLSLKLKDLETRKLNFISLTPGTSFDTSIGMGTSQERVVLFKLIQQAWGFAENRVAPRNVMAGWADVETFEDKLRQFDAESIAPSIGKKFVEEIGKRQDLKEEFEHLCKLYHKSNARIDDEGKAKRTEFIQNLRAELASLSILALQPDLIILDEFQRFKNLLKSSDETSSVVSRLFKQRDVRMILLSATPYKMLSLHHEAEEDHYQDFIATVDFLSNGSATKTCCDLIRDYREVLFTLAGEAKFERLVQVKNELEGTLKKIMVRTEKLAISVDRGGMLEEKLDCGLVIKSSDVRAFVGVSRVADQFEQNNLVEYWKSAPYLLNFMDGYQLKKEIKSGLDDKDIRRSLAKILSQFPDVQLPHSAIQNYEEIDEKNPRLRSLIDDVVRSGAWKLLWIPPALPYYQLNGAFADPKLKGFTKRLVFTCWQVATKAIASLATYAAEREMMRLAHENPINTPDTRKNLGGLLGLETAHEKLSGLSTLALLYPSISLCHECSPRHRWANSKEEVLKDFENQINTLLSQLPFSLVDTGRPDETWYWAAPILLDIHLHREESLNFLKDSGWLDTLATEEFIADEASPKTPLKQAIDNDLVQRISRWISGDFDLGRQPEDLAVVLSKVACGGLGNCVLRSLAISWAPKLSENLKPDEQKQHTLKGRLLAAKTARSLLALFNTPEATAVIRGNRLKQPYWIEVLDYACDGCFQAVLDEFVHILSEKMEKKVDNKLFERVCEEIESAATIRTSALGVEHFQFTPAGQSLEREFRADKMRTRFAMRYSLEKEQNEEGISRPQQVREAFNSPFWPFVLATTSVGQEGLDFHPYCHVVMHWNLPANPVDLEQREGRLHRYKCHAVRKNVAASYRTEALQKSSGDDAKTWDPWEVAFEMAKENRSPSDTDIVPYWVFRGDAKIQRCIPTLPFSKEENRIEELRKALTIYRMIFGQNRQEDLLGYLENALSTDQILRVTREATLDLSPV